MAGTPETFAKLAGIRNSVARVLEPNERTGRMPMSFSSDDVGNLFQRSAFLIAELRRTLPGLYGDLPEFLTAPDTAMATVEEKTWYSRRLVERLARELDEVFEVRANSELSAPSSNAAAKRTVFLSHGRAPDWREVQAFIERDVKLRTIELEQEPSEGRTVLGKLAEASDRCDSAVIVMTGDDHGSDGSVRARENVMHEIGFFQGKLGLSRVCLLHEEGVNIPSNLAGVVYMPFTKGMIRAVFHVLQRELSAMYKN